MLEGVYRSKQSESAFDGLRVVEQSVHTFATGSRCRACGATNAHPARPMCGPDFEKHSRDARTGPGPVVLCAECAGAQDRFESRAGVTIMLSSISIAIAVVWSTVAQVLDRLLSIEADHRAGIAGLTFFHLSLFVVLRRRQRRQLLPAVVLSCRSGLMKVQLASPDVRRAPPARFEPGTDTSIALDAWFWLAMYAGAVCLFYFGRWAKH